MSSRDTAAVSLTPLPEFRGPRSLNAPRKARTSAIRAGGRHASFRRQGPHLQDRPSESGNC
jgi:hypothetical protein